MPHKKFKTCQKILYYLLYIRKHQLFLHAVNVSRFPASKSMATGSGKMFCEVKCMLAYKVTIKLTNSLSIKQISDMLCCGHFNYNKNMR